MMMWLGFSILGYSEFLKECGRNIAEAYHLVKMFSMQNAPISAVQLTGKFHGQHDLYGRSRSMTTVTFSVPGLIG